MPVHLLTAPLGGDCQLRQWPDAVAYGIKTPRHLVWHQVLPCQVLGAQEMISTGAFSTSHCISFDKVRQAQKTDNIS